MTLVEFLLARIAEDEAAARGAPPSPWWVDDTSCCVMHSGHPADRDVADSTDAAVHIARWQPSRVLAECEAKRRIIAECALGLDEYDTTPYGGASGLADDVLRLLAAPYSGHSDFRDVWGVQ